ncbi:MAG: hypothetical protein WCG21_03395 [Eubacteriales bacterium]
MKSKATGVLASLITGCILLSSCSASASTQKDVQKIVLESAAAETLGAADSKDAADTADSFMKAVKEQDADSIEALSAYSAADFRTDDFTGAAPAAIFANMTYEITGDPVYEGQGKAWVPVSGKYPALLPAIVFVMEDTPLVASLSKDNFYAGQWGVPSEELQKTTFLGLYDAIAKRLADKDAVTTSFEGKIYLEKEKSADKWVVARIPKELTDVAVWATSINPMEYIPDFKATTQAVLDLLIADGTITQEQSDTYIRENQMGPDAAVTGGADTTADGSTDAA